MLVVSFANTSSNPSAVMIKPNDTIVAAITMRTPQRSVDIANGAVS